MLLNIPTLVVMDIYILLLVGVLMVHAWSRGHRDATLGYLALALLLGASGTLLGSLRGLGIDVVPIVIGNLLLHISAALNWTALRVFVGRKLYLPGVLAGAVLWGLLCLIPFFYESLALRVLVGSLTTAAYALLAIIELWRSRSQLEVDYRPALALLVFHAGFYTVRAIFDRGMPFDTVAQGNTFFAVLVMETLLYAIGISFVILAMVKERAELRYKSAALRDPLTGIGNRRAFISSAEALLLDCKRLQRPAVMLLCDLDYFKRLNDSFGHAVGDQALAGFSQILSSRTRHQDVCARIGGEEFACLLADADHGVALVLAERVRREFAELPFIPGAQLSVSIGIADADQANYDLNQLLSLADQALYAAKAAGRNRVEIYRAVG